jgi:hypothetical protein
LDQIIAERRSRRLLWLAFALSLPLPFMALQLGFAPPLRMFFLALLSFGFFLSAPEAASGMLTVVLAVQGLLWLLGTRLLARFVTSAMGGSGGVDTRRLIAVLGGLVVLALLPVYRLPFSSGERQTSWLGLFQ